VERHASAAHAADERHQCDLGDHHIIIVGAMLAAALTETVLGKSMGVLAVALAAVNVFGGFLVTRRMLEMFKKKAPKAVKGEK